jgi:hypothetical protein
MSVGPLESQFERQLRDRNSMLVRCCQPAFITINHSGLPGLVSQQLLSLLRLAAYSRTWTVCKLQIAPTKEFRRVLEIAQRYVNVLKKHLQHNLQQGDKQQQAQQQQQQRPASSSAKVGWQQGCESV